MDKNAGNRRAVLFLFCCVFFFLGGGEGGGRGRHSQTYSETEFTPFYPIYGGGLNQSTPLAL